jgi:hypothetical protein
VSRANGAVIEQQLAAVAGLGPAFDLAPLAAAGILAQLRGEDDLDLGMFADVLGPRIDRLRVSSNGAADALEAGWLDGDAMDPLGANVEPLPPLPGFPYLHAGCGALIVGPTGGGRSALVQSGGYDAAIAGLRVAYLGSEVTLPEFYARARDLAGRRGDEVTDELREALARVRYLTLASVIVNANKDPKRWVADIVERYDVVIIDPLSVAANALDLDFDSSNREFAGFYDRLVQPVVNQGRAVVLVDNVGHSPDARKRAKGASAKSDKADLTFACKLQNTGRRGLIIETRKVRSVRAAVRHGDRWLFVETSRTIERLEHDQQDGGDFRPTGLMERVSKYLEAVPITQQAATGIEIRTSVSGRASYIDQALGLLIAEGYVEAHEDGQARRHRSVKPYREADVGTTGRGRDEVNDQDDHKES